MKRVLTVENNHLKREVILNKMGRMTVKEEAIKAL